MLTTLADRPVFEALSYTWKDCSDGSNILHEETQTHSEAHYCISCSSYRLQISVGLYNALKRLRYIIGERPLWIDQICINQLDLVERGNQVQLMREIYSAARQVILWIGESDSYTATAFEIVEELSKAVRELRVEVLDIAKNVIPRNMVGNPTHELYEQFWNAMEAASEDFPADGYIFIPSKETIEADPEKICLPPQTEWIALAYLYNRPVFRRIWIVQELCVAKKVVVLCGAHRTAWDNVAKVAYLLRHKSWLDVQLELYLQVGRKLSVKEVTALRDLQTLHRLTLLTEMSWREVMTRTMDFKSTDPRDKIIALLGIRLPVGSAAEFLFQPDYSLSEASVYRIATQAIITTENSLSILSHLKDKSLHLVSGLPSWVPDFSVCTEDDFTPGSQISARQIGRASGDSTTCVSWPSDEDPSLLVTKAYVIDTIIEVGDEYGDEEDGKVYCNWTDLALRLRDFFDDEKTLLSTFWRTCVMDCSEDGIHPAPDDCFSKFCLIVMKLVIRDYGGQFPPLNPILKEILKDGLDTLAFEETDRTEIISTHLWASPVKRRFYITHAGYMGLCQRSVSPGDQVCILSGGENPFVLRKIREEGISYPIYNLQGDCYLDSFMDGEALLTDSFKWQDIELQ